MSAVDPSAEPELLLAAERVRTRERIGSLNRDLAAVIAASEHSNADDEHDPEGATIGFERAQIIALLDRARRDLGDLERALTRVEAGAYGWCEVCGGSIAPARLAARPTTRTCITCAAVGRGRAAVSRGARTRPDRG